jgi:hypothetical protein
MTQIVSYVKTDISYVEAWLICFDLQFLSYWNSFDFKTKKMYKRNSIYTKRSYAYISFLSLFAWLLLQVLNSKLD